MKRFQLIAITLLIATITANATGTDITEGALQRIDSDGVVISVPLKHTSVKAEISGFLTRVNVKQEFENDLAEAIEAVYVFPLSHDGAVDRMSMRIGSRVINGEIMRREDARKTYEAAKRAGQTVALLDQERPNIFTQAVANILPGEKIVIEISYVETLKYENGAYEFVFPMVVSPRYVPGETDGSKITPRAFSSRSGQDISIEVNIDAGVPIERIDTPLHETNEISFGVGSSAVRLAESGAIPNRDFILRYDVTGEKIEDAVLVHRDERGGFFSMILQPPDDMTVEDVTPKEIVFVLDSSGSMSGFPIEKAKETIALSLKGLHPRDTFNIITFAGDTNILFEQPVPATRANLDIANQFIQSRSGGGGTVMMKAIRASLDPSDSQEHLRIVCFLTDGQIGNDMAIIDEIQKHPNARVFSFGIGNSVNRYLLENMAKEGNGEAEIVTLSGESQAAAERFYKRVRSPILTDIEIDWNGLVVKDVYPSKLTDLFTAKPVIVNGRFDQIQKGSIKLKGKIAGQYYEREILVDFPEAEERHDVLATIWARRKVAGLMSNDLKGIQDGRGEKEIEEEITKIGLDYGILTQFTSFVAVEERVVNPGGNPVKVAVPVEVPDGQESANGDSPFRRLEIRNKLSQAQKFKYQRMKTGGGVTYGGAKAATVAKSGGIGGGTGSGSGTSNNVSQQVTATVDVTTSSATVVNLSDTKIDTSVSKEASDTLPRSTTFSSLLKTAPNVRPEAKGAGFQVDGISARESEFVVDGKEVVNFRTATATTRIRTIDDKLTTSVATLEKPEIPEKAKWSEADSIVKVVFAVNDAGDVVKAKAVTGNKSLKKPSEAAAMGSKFTPPVVEGDKMPMSGTIAYKFVDRENIEITLEAMQVELTPAKRRALTKKYKLHFWVYDLVDRLDSGTSDPSEFEAKFVADGVADLRIVLNDGAKNAAKVLKKAGLKIYKTSGDLVYGKIKIEKIYDLAELEQVQYVSP